MAHNGKLTGRFRFRKSIFGKLILQVEYEKYHCDDPYGYGYWDEWYTRHWRDAKESDMGLQISIAQRTIDSFSLASQIPAKG